VAVTLVAAGADRWVVMAAGSLTVATVVVAVRGDERPLVLAVATRPQARFYEYKHVVSFEETNLVGNVYYTNLLSWQGRCRELFLRDHAPVVLDQLARDLRLVTLHCSCDYLAELSAFEEVAIRMRLKALASDQIALGFEYWRPSGAGEELVARREQRIACMKREGSRMVPAAVPEALRAALQAYS
jgi:enediyne biosynthesis thioesterase